MKSAHRHELETNVLAHRLEAYIDRFRPYSSTVAGVLIAIVVLMFIWSYVSGSSSERSSGAWDSYNHAVSTMPPNLEQLRRTAEDYPGTKIQQMADVTWADGQVWMASRNYIYNRKAAMDALNNATSRYQGVIQSSNDERLASRARLGLARIYEMQNEVDKAREQYQQVSGAYAKYAEQQAERLSRSEAKDTYAWLATAQPPRPKTPIGPGTPGVQPDFSPSDIALPGTTEADAGKLENTKGAAGSFEDLLKSMQQESKANEAANRYEQSQPPATDSKATPPGTDANPSEAKGDAAPANAGSTESKSAESAPATEKAEK